MKTAIAPLLLALLPLGLHAQGNYEIQTYPSETQDPGTTMVELHSNFTFEGSKGETDGVLGTEHQLHETVEITQGINPWFELGFYIFTSADAREGWQWVGDHIRPRVRVPEDWKWPVGVSLSVEIGYQRYLYFSRHLDHGAAADCGQATGALVHGVQPGAGPRLSRAGRASGLDVFAEREGGLRFHQEDQRGVRILWNAGHADRLYPIPQQTQDLFAVTDLNLSPKWEFNFGVGMGLTGATDHLIVKMILGRRFGKAAATN